MYGKFPKTEKSVQTCRVLFDLKGDGTSISASQWIQGEHGQSIIFNFKLSLCVIERKLHRFDRRKRSTKNIVQDFLIIMLRPARQTWYEQPDNFPVFMNVHIWSLFDLSEPDAKKRDWVPWYVQSLQTFRNPWQEKQRKIQREKYKRKLFCRQNMSCNSNSRTEGEKEKKRVDRLARFVYLHDRYLCVCFLLW